MQGLERWIDLLQRMHPCHALLKNLTTGCICSVARRVILNEGSVKKQNVIASLLRVTSLNLWGLGGTLVGLQVCSVHACVSLHACALYRRFPPPHVGFLGP